MARLYKCPTCEGKDVEANMVIDYIGKVKKRFHKDCHRKHLADLEFKKKEKEELDELVEVIKRVHGIEIIPHQFFSHLQDIRNGNELFGRVGEKRSKAGYSYKVIARTYQENTDAINWAMNNRNFSGTLNLLLYTRAIVKDKIAGVQYKIDNERSQLEDQQRHTELIKDYMEDDWTFNNEDNENDISDLLD